MTGVCFVIRVMTHTPHISPAATARDAARTPQPSRPTFGEILEEVVTLTGGLVVGLLPLLLLSVPGIILFFVLPALLLLALALPLGLVAAVLALPPYLLARRRRRHPRRRVLRRAGLRPHAAVG
jgi:hypothetical protein